jgi:tRNA(Arg) A34 adenosine deaminase TadA
MTSTDTRFMELAIEKAVEGVKAGQAPFAACIVKDGKVVSCTHNRVRESMDITAHAEVKAIREACAKLETINLAGCTIYSTCEPCPMCFGAIHWAKISRIVWGARIEDSEMLGFKELLISNASMKRMGNSRVRITANFMRTESLRVFRMWASRRDRKTY